MAIEAYYRQLILKRPSQTVDAFGDTSTTQTLIGTIQGYIGRPNSNQVQAMAQQGINITGRLYAPLSANVREYDVITDTDGRAFEVRGVPRDVAGRGHHIEADLVELRGGVS